MREMLIGAAGQGCFLPLWSDRILEEWARAAAKRNPADEVIARGEIAQLSARWSRAKVRPDPGLEARLWLPDTADVHVLAAAVAGSADVIITMNAKDFPRNILAEEGLARADPDGFLLGCYEANPDAIQHVAQGVLQTARRLSGKDWALRALLKKARLPRLGKTLDRS